MTNRKILDVINRYEIELSKIKNPVTSEAHIVGMLPKMRKFLEEGRRDKVFRWLGFIQGVLFSYAWYTIEDMKNHNRPTKEDIKLDYEGHNFASLELFQRYGTACPHVDCKRAHCLLAEEYEKAPEEKDINWKMG